MMLKIDNLSATVQWLDDAIKEGKDIPKKQARRALVALTSPATRRNYSGQSLKVRESFVLGNSSQAVYYEGVFYTICSVGIASMCGGIVYKICPTHTADGLSVLKSKLGGSNYIGFPLGATEEDDDYWDDDEDEWQENVHADEELGGPLGMILFDMADTIPHATQAALLRNIVTSLTDVREDWEGVISPHSSSLVKLASNLWGCFTTYPEHAQLEHYYAGKPVTKYWLDNTSVPSDSTFTDAQTADIGKGWTTHYYMNLKKTSMFHQEPDSTMYLLDWIKEHVLPALVYHVKGKEKIPSKALLTDNCSQPSRTGNTLENFRTNIVLAAFKYYKQDLIQFLESICPGHSFSWVEFPAAGNPNEGGHDILGGILLIDHEAYRPTGYRI
jgi:hypothetical protein